MSEINDFIEHAREKGMDHATIRTLLQANGWKEKDIVEALAQTTLEMPIPAPPDSGTAREAFLHLLASVAYYAALISIGVILFSGVNRLFPDPAWPDWREYGVKSAIRWSIAFILVSVPVYLWLSRMINRLMIAKPEQAWSPTRRWLSHLTLFLSSIALLIDLVTMLFYLLEGELTTRFVLKVGIVFLLAGLTLSYYLLSLRLPVESAAARRTRRAFLCAGLAVAISTAAWGFAIVGSPGLERDRKFDRRRVDDLRTIYQTIGEVTYGRHFYWDRANQRYGETPKGPLPESLEALIERAQEQGTHTRPDIVDPETNEPYGYEVLNEHSFRLGARFATARDEKHDARWNHDEGWVWFTIDFEEE